MPPKKTTNGTGGEVPEGGKFVWEGPNDNKLLLLTQGRYVKPDEYEQLASAFPGATNGSIRNRISALRVKQRNMYEELDWKLPEGGAGHSTKKLKATPSKRAFGENGEPETPTKKPRAPRKKKGPMSASPEKQDSFAEDDEEMGVAIKEEVVDEVEEEV